MSLTGGAVFIGWHDMPQGKRENFYAWNDGEHLPSRLRIPGFLRARRFAATAPGVEFLTLIEVAGTSTFESEPYLKEFNNPLPWAKRSLPDYVNRSRIIVDVAATQGDADGGFLVAYQFVGAEAGLAKLRESLAAITRQQQVLAVHCCAGGAIAKKENDQLIGAMLVETSTAEAASAGARGVESALAESGFTVKMPSNIYRLEALHLAKGRG